MVTHTRIKYADDDEYEYPDWAVGIGWSLCILTFVPLPMSAITQIYFKRGSLRTVSITLSYQCHVIVLSFLHRHKVGHLLSIFLSTKSEFN